MCWQMLMSLRSECEDMVMQVKTLGFWGISSFVFSFFKWFFSATSGTQSCGFDSWPTFGMQALNYRWNFDFEQTYIGVGAPHFRGLPAIGLSLDCLTGSV
jgi:hypothetical protein